MSIRVLQRVWKFDTSTQQYYNYPQGINGAEYGYLGGTTASSYRYTFPAYGASSTAGSEVWVSWHTVSDDYEFVGWAWEPQTTSVVPSLLNPNGPSPTVMYLDTTYGGHIYKPGEVLDIVGESGRQNYYMMTAVYRAKVTYSGRVVYYADMNGDTVGRSEDLTFNEPVHHFDVYGGFVPVAPEQHTHFAGWSSAPNQARVIWTEGADATVNASSVKELYPVFEADSGYRWFRIIYHGDNSFWGTDRIPSFKAVGIASVVTTDGSAELVIGHEAPSIEGYRFDHWATETVSSTNTRVEGTAYADGTSVVLPTAYGNYDYLDLFPVYNAIVDVEYVLTLDPSGGSIGTTPTVQTYTGTETSKTFTIPVPTWENHTFRGWFDGTNRLAVTATSYTIYSSNPKVTLTALWDDEVTMRFVVHISDVLSDVYYEETKRQTSRTFTFTFPSAPTREGYRFVTYQGTTSTYPSIQYKQPGDTVTDTVPANNYSRTSNWYSVWEVTTRPVTIRFDVNGSSLAKPADRTEFINPNQDGTFNATVGDLPRPVDAVVSIDGSRALHRFAGWSLTPDGEPVTSVTFDQDSTEVTLYALWTVVYAQYGDITPHASLWIFNRNGGYMDASYLQTVGGEVVVDRAENRAGSFTFTLVNDYNQPGHTLLAEDCNLWSDGYVGPVEVGMYVMVGNIRSTSRSEPMVDGHITTISPAGNGTTISFQCADMIGVYGKLGYDIRRNYRDGMGSPKVFDVFDVGGHPAFRPTGGAYSGGKVIYSTIENETRGQDVDGETFIVAGMAHATFPCLVARLSFDREDVARVRQIRIPLQSQHGFENARGYVYIESNGRRSGSVNWAGTKNSGILNVDWADSAGFAVDDGRFDIVIYATKADTLGDGWISIGNASYFTWHLRNVANSDDTSITEAGKDGHTGNKTFEHYLYYDVLHDTTDLTAGASTITLNAVDWADFEAFPRNRVTANILDQTVSTMTVMGEVAKAVGLETNADDSLLPADATALYEYRAGGASATDLFTKLCDVPDIENGTDGTRSYYITDGRLYIGTRWKVSDGAVCTIAYGGHDMDSDEDVVLASGINVAMTLKGRPSIVTVRTTIADDDGERIPLAVTLEDPTSTEFRQVSISELITDTATDSIYGAVATAYGALTDNTLDRWEGTVVLPGIVTEINGNEVIATNGPHAGSGIPVSLYDQRIGLYGVPTRVRQVRWDYNTCTTTLTLGNYDARYSSAIADSVALPITVANLAGGASNLDMWNEQSAYVSFKTAIRPKLTDNAWFRVAEDIDVPADVEYYKLAGNRVLAVVTAKADSTTATHEVYGLTGVRIGNTLVEIPEPRRPDFMEGQRATVSILFHS